MVYRAKRDDDYMVSQEAFPSLDAALAILEGRGVDTDASEAV